MQRFTQAVNGTTLWVALGALLVGFLAGQAWLGGRVSAQTSTPNSDDATATRESELEELERLRAQVAGTPMAVVCTPAPTATVTPEPSPTATPTPVPPVAAGQPLPYTDDWTVTVSGVSLMPTFADLTATGSFARVDLVITNDGTRRRRFPYGDLVLLDNQGRTFEPDPVVAGRNEAGFLAGFPPSVPTPGFVIFSVAADAEGPFVLASTEDPTFRVEISQERSG